MNTPASLPVKLLDRKSDEYAAYGATWRSLDLLYAGGIRLKNDGQEFLTKRPKEHYDVYQERYRRLTYQNILANCIGWYSGKLFASEPKIEMKTDDPKAAKFLMDVDRAGTTFFDAAKFWFERQMLFRSVYVLVDKPGSTIVAQTRAQETALGLDQPYLVTYDPSNVLNVGRDEFGCITWAVVKTVTTQQATPTDDPSMVAHWYLFDRTDYAHYRFVSDGQTAITSQMFLQMTAKDDETQRASLVSTGPHALSSIGRVPLLCLDLPESLWFTNRSYLHLCEHLNHHNAYSWALFMSCFPQLVIKADGDVGGKTLSEVGYLKIGQQDDAMYLEPSGTTFDEMRQYLDRLREESYRGFHLQAQGKSSSATADGSSGYSKEMDMAPSTDMLNALGNRQRQQQQDVLAMYKAAAGMPYQDDATPDVNGYKFEIKPAMKALELLTAITDSGLLPKSPTLEKVADIRVAMEIIDGENADTKAKVIGELENAPSRAAMADTAAQQQADMQKQAFQASFDRNLTKDIIQQQAA